MFWCSTFLSGWRESVQEPQHLPGLPHQGLFRLREVRACDPQEVCRASRACLQASSPRDAPTHTAEEMRSDLRLGCAPPREGCCGHVRSVLGGRDACECAEKDILFSNILITVPPSMRGGTFTCTGTQNFGSHECLNLS